MLIHGFLQCVNLFTHWKVRDFDDFDVSADGAVTIAPDDAGDAINITNANADFKDTFTTEFYEFDKNSNARTDRSEKIKDLSVQRR